MSCHGIRHVDRSNIALLVGPLDYGNISINIFRPANLKKEIGDMVFKKNEGVYLSYGIIDIVVITPRKNLFVRIS
jgi:hypothetical protein